MQYTPRVKIPRIIVFIILTFYIAFCGCDPAQSKNVPSDFVKEHFDELVSYSVREYLNPDSIDISRAYVGAASAALKSFPYPLMLMSKEFYENRKKFQDASRFDSGTGACAGSGKSYVIFEPDYVKMEKLVDRTRKVEQKRIEKMDKAEKLKYFQESRDKLKAEQKFREQTWKKVAFTRKDFYRVMGWIKKNKDNPTYQKPPATYKGENPYAKDPFGMHHAYFAATNGFLQTLDPHSGVIDRESWDRIRKESEDSSFEGIGALLRGGGTRDVIVETPLPGSPALNSGLKAGDIIRKVDGKSIDSLPLSQVVKRIRGKKDTIVALYVERPAELKFLTVKIKRGLIVQKSVSSRYLPEKKVGVIKLNSFLYSSDAAKPTGLVKAEYKKLTEQAGGKLKGLVLDLRNNSGGDLREAITISGLFVPRGKVVVKIKGKDDYSQSSKRNPISPMVPMKGDRPAFPVVVLINGGSASASEIVASALMDHGVALVLGERSFGKASVQTLHPWGDVILKLTSARYYAPEGYTIQVHGVKPDIEISDELDGTFPPRFREEDMWQHLPRLVNRKESPARKAWVEKLSKICG